MTENYLSYGREETKQGLWDCAARCQQRPTVSDATRDGYTCGGELSLGKTGGFLCDFVASPEIQHQPWIGPSSIRQVAGKFCTYFLACLSPFFFRPLDASGTSRRHCLSIHEQGRPERLSQQTNKTNRRGPTAVRLRTSILHLDQVTCTFLLIVCQLFWCSYRVVFISDKITPGFVYHSKKKRTKQKAKQNTDTSYLDLAALFEANNNNSNIINHLHHLYSLQESCVCQEKVDR